MKYFQSFNNFLNERLGKDDLAMIDDVQEYLVNNKKLKGDARTSAEGIMNSTFGDMQELEFKYNKGGASAGAEYVLDNLPKAAIKKYLNEAFESIADLTKALHFETDPKTAEEMKIEIGKRQGEVTRRKQIEGGEYSLRRFRKEIKYGDGKDLGVFIPGGYDAATSSLGDGPHTKKAPKVKWNQRKYAKWLEDVASNDGWKNAFDMAQNARFEPGLLDWAKKQFRGEDPLQRIQWDIEAFAESVVTEAKKYKAKDIIDAWEDAYGEDIMNSDHADVPDDIDNDYRGKITIKDLEEIFDDRYGEELSPEFLEALGESVVTEAQVKVHSWFGQRKEFRDWLKKHKVEVVSAEGEDGKDTIELVLTGKTKDLKKILKSDHKFGWDDKQMWAYIEESVVTEGVLSNVRKAVAKTQGALKKKWAKKGGYENFGQDEIRDLEDKYDYNSMIYGTPEERKAAKLIDGLNQWAMNYVGESVTNEANTFTDKWEREEAEFKRIIAAPDKRVYDLVDYVQFSTGGMTEKDWEKFMYGRYKKNLQSTDSKTKEKMYKVLQKMVLESEMISESATETLAKEIQDAEYYIAHGDGSTIEARSTKKTWDDGVPVLKYIARGKKQMVKTPKGSFELVVDKKYGWYYWENKGTWYGANIEYGATPPFEF